MKKDEKLTKDKGQPVIKGTIEAGDVPSVNEQAERVDTRPTTFDVNKASRGEDPWGKLGDPEE